MIVCITGFAFRDLRITLQLRYDRQAKEAGSLA
jgi:hypothetical protein